MAKLVWNLKSGHAVNADDATARGRDIVLAQIQDPFGAPWSTPQFVNTGVATIDVFGLDRRMALVLSGFFRRSGWWIANLASYDPLAEWTGVDGEGWAVTLTAYALRRDDSGTVHQLGKINPTLFLSGGNFGGNGTPAATGDGCEIVDGADGVRFVFGFEADAPTPDGNSNEMPAWDLCCSLELKPNVVMSPCEAQAIVDHIEATVPKTVTLRPPYGAS